MNRFSSLCLTVSVLFCLSAVATATAPQDDRPAAVEGDSRVTVTVGMEGYMKQVVLPGSELTVREVDPRRTPVALRIDAVFPHGDELRYDLTFYGLEPGSHNICEYLVRKDGSSTDDLPALPVTIESLLPSGDVRPSAPPQGFLTRIGGYQTAMILAGVIWVLGLFAILFLGRGKEDRTAEGPAVAEVSEVEQIRQLINEAMESEELTADRKAQLDMKVLNFWRGRRHIEDASVGDALQQLREDEQAGPLLAGLERWFYSRNAPSADEIRQMLDQLKQHSLSEQRATGGVS